MIFKKSTFFTEMEKPIHTEDEEEEKEEEEEEISDQQDKDLVP